MPTLKDININIKEKQSLSSLPAPRAWEEAPKLPASTPDWGGHHSGTFNGGLNHESGMSLFQWNGGSIRLKTSKHILAGNVRV